MCFAPQRRGLFRHQLPKVVREWCALYILTSKCASRHNGVQFFISHLARWLRTRRFSEPTFRPSGATNIGKTQCFATFLPFRASASSFFWLFLFSDLLSSTLLLSLTLPISAFHLSILSEVWLLNFLRWIEIYIYIHRERESEREREGGMRGVVYTIIHAGNFSFVQSWHHN